VIEVRADQEPPSDYRPSVELQPKFLHDLTNALTIVIGQLFLLQLDETVSPSVRERLNAIEIASDRIGKLIKAQRP
jgi:signal transduction histidine kinase